MHLQHIDRHEHSSLFLHKEYLLHCYRPVMYQVHGPNHSCPNHGGFEPGNNCRSATPFSLRSDAKLCRHNKTLVQRHVLRTKWRGHVQATEKKQYNLANL